MANRKIIALLLVTSITLSFIACNNQKKDIVKEDSKEIIETITDEYEETNNVEEDSSEAEEVKEELQDEQQTTEEKKKKSNEVAITNNNSANKEENKPSTNNNGNSSNDAKSNNSTTNNTNTSNNTQQNNNSEKQETPAPQPTPTAPAKTYKVRGDLVNTAFSAVNNYTSTNLNKKLTLTGTYNSVGEKYIAYRIGQGETPTAINVKYTYLETDSISMITEMPEVIGDRYIGQSECSVVVVENNGMYYIVFVSKY